MENVIQIQPYQRMSSWNPLPGRNQRSKKPAKKSDRNKKSQILNLFKLADDTHKILVMKNSPIRLCVYEQDDDLLMDVLAMNPTEADNKIFSRSVSDDKFTQLVRQIHTQRGLVLDYRV